MIYVSIISGNKEVEHRGWQWEVYAMEWEWEYDDVSGSARWTAFVGLDRAGDGQERQ